MSAPDPCHAYRVMARNAALANQRLARACAALQPGEWEAPRVSFFPSLVQTLNHICYVDLFYIDAMEGGTLGPAAWADPVPYPAFADWAKAQAAMDARLLRLVEGLRPEDLGRPVFVHRQTRVQHAVMSEVLLHLMLHDQHHRGQVHAMLSGTSVAPPQLDEFVMADDAATRVADLAAMGWDEGRLLS